MYAWNGNPEKAWINIVIWGVIDYSKCILTAFFQCVSYHLSSYVSRNLGYMLGITRFHKRLNFGD